jgi:C1A family cysteine protease
MSKSLADVMGGKLSKEDEAEVASRRKYRSSNAEKSGVDAWAATGGEGQQARMEMRTLAISDPSRYSALSNTSLSEIKDQVNAGYDHQLKSYMATGMDLAQAEKEALSDANATKNILMKTHNRQFPSGDTSLYMGATARESGSYVNTFGKTRAPAKKRKSRKK